MTGKCSVPTWCMGMPAGFCDEPAFGPQEPEQERYGDYGPGMTASGRWSPHVFRPAFAPALACYEHGGPKKKPATSGEEK